MKLKALIVLTVCILVTIPFCGSSGCGSKAVEIPDGDLEVMIRQALGKTEGDIAPWELEEIRTLHLSRSEIYQVPHTTGTIHDLTGLEYCTNLEYLDLTINAVNDLSPLASCTKLKTLLLYKNEITELSPLVTCTMLETLDVSNNQVTDISALAHCSMLETLYLQNNTVTDISPLGSISSLKSAYLFNNQISDISALSQQYNLGILMLGETWDASRYIFDPYVPGESNHVTDLWPLAELRSLEYLNLNANEVNDISPLENLTGLKKLFLAANNIEDITVLFHLQALEELNIAANNVQYLNPLLEIPGLKRLNLFNVESKKYEENLDTARALYESGIDLGLEDDSPPDTAYPLDRE